MKAGKKKLRKLTRIARNGIAKIRLRGNKGRGEQLNTILQALNYFCTHTTLHGLRYVVDSELHIIWRFLWLIVFIVSSTIASNVIYSLAFRFQVKHIYKKKICWFWCSWIYNLPKIRAVYFWFRRTFVVSKVDDIKINFYQTSKYRRNRVNLFRLRQHRLALNRCITRLRIYLSQVWLFVQMIASTGIEFLSSNQEFSLILRTTQVSKLFGKYWSSFPRWLSGISTIWIFWKIRMFIVSRVGHFISS